MTKSRSFHIETLDQRQRLQQFIGAREIPFQVDVGPIRRQRTLPQNRRLWALHALASDYTGLTTDEMHEEALCKVYGYTEHTMPTGWIKRVPLMRSSPRDPKEFGEFMEKIEAWYATEFGVWFKDE